MTMHFIRDEHGALVRIQNTQLFPGLVMNPDPQDLAREPPFDASENIKNFVAVDAGQGRTRGGLKQFNSANWASTLGMAIFQQSPEGSGTNGVFALPIQTTGELVGLGSFVTPSGTDL